MSIAPPFVVIQSGPHGRWIKSTKAIKRGQCVLFDAPLVVKRLEDSFAPLQPGQPQLLRNDEWYLTKQILAHGERAEFAEDFIATERASEVEVPACVQALAREFQCERKDVLAVFRVVANNAFSLDSAVLQVKYGAALYSTASFFNHSCAPNCLSLRMGGNMAIFACQDVPPGVELTHSYIPSHLLLAPLTTRALHLHFECNCVRCTEERCGKDKERPPVSSKPIPKQLVKTRDKVPSATLLAKLGFPPNHGGSGSAGDAVGAFKLACVLADEREHKVSEAVMILAKGQDALAHNFALLHARPLAALEIVRPMLATLWVSLVSADDGDSHNDKNDQNNEKKGEGGRNNNQNNLGPVDVLLAPVQEGIKAAVRLQRHALAQLWERRHQLRLPAPVLRDCMVIADLEMYILSGSRKAVTVPLLLHALSDLAGAHGNSLDCLREDLACLSVLTPSASPSSPCANKVLAKPSLQVVALACARVQLQTEDLPRHLREELEGEVCALWGCGIGEDTCGTQVTPPRLLRCARCKHTMYCSKDHQRAHWKRHRPFCSSEFPS